MDDRDEFVFDLTDDEVKALELPYEVAPAPALKIEAKASRETRQDDLAPRSGPDPEMLLKRIRDAEERASSERTRRIEAERLAHDRSTTIAVSDARVAESDFHAVANAMAKAESDIVSIKAAHKAALEAGDYEAATEASDKLAEARANHAQLRDGKGALEDRVRSLRDKAKVASERAPPKVEAEQPADPFERFLTQFGPREQAWFRAHPECATDPELNAKAVSAHHNALKNNIAANSDEYYAHLDRIMGFGGDSNVSKTEVKESKASDDDDGVVVDSKPSTKRVAAPVSRDSTVVTRRADGKMQVRLTREQADMAESLGMTPSAYAKGLIAAEAGGLLGTGNR